MEKQWIKLLSNVGDLKAGETVEVDKSVADAYIKAKLAEDATKAATGAIDDGLKAALDKSVKELVGAVSDRLGEATKAIKEAKHVPGDSRVDAGESEDDKKLPTGGFKSLGHIATLVHAVGPDGTGSTEAAKQLGEYKALVTRATASGMSEGVDPDGGLLVPGDFSTRIWDRIRESESLYNRLDVMPIRGNSLSIPAINETSRANGSRYGGVSAFWIGEAEQYKKSKPTFRNIELKLKKLTVLTFVTNELLEDSPFALDSYLSRVAADEIGFKVNDAIINGTGAGMPLGILQSDATVAVAKESGQAAASIVAMNIEKMYARMYAPSRKNAVWLYNQAIEPQLGTLVAGTQGVPAYLPPGGYSAKPYGTLKGLPMIPIEQASALGTKGDLMLVDLSQVLAIGKGLKQDMSIHLRFDYDETAFKFSLRMDAQPAWESPLTPYKGADTLSPFVVLADRA